ncbi:AAEL008726-PA [Aedes aegypti]|uniref:AAEL008726-PA n=1 Tax=Aedes aegypti TaxID=7159 RepID=Q16XY8_AEDAE|nr:AAEL008726-PA [Aedes aegypti]
MRLKMHANLAVKLSLLSLALTHICVSAIETPEPSSLLRPRDINPHPYGNAYEGVSIFDKSIITNSEKFMENLLNQAPIQFPRVTNSAAMNALPHPYEKFALKERLAKTERFSGADNQIVKPAYKALAKYAARVLNGQVGNSFAEEDFDHYNEATNLKKHYAFSYTVKDSASGDDFSHTQQQQVDGAVKGSYKVQLPDGRMQIVKYIADNNGYRADVTYENDNGQNFNHVTASPTVIQSPIAAAPVVSPLESAQPIYNYYKRLHQSQQYVQQPVPLRQARPQQAIYYAQATPTQIPAPYYPAQLRVNDVKIHNYNTGPHANSLIRSTLAPAHRSYVAYQPASNIAYVSSTPNPAQIQSNTLAQAGLIPVVVTTAQPYPIYRDINVTPPSIGPTLRRTTIYANQATPRPVTYTPVAPVQSSQPGADYDYVQIPASNHVYKRNSDKDSQVTKSSVQSPHKKKSLE